MLFRIKDLRVPPEPDQEPEQEQPAGIRVAGAVRHVVGRKGARLSELLGPLQANEHVHIPSFGSWSMHNMLEEILKQTGPADVWITSWTITEQPVRRILDLMDQGTIRKLRMLLSERVEAMNPAAHQLARFNMDVRLTKIHAKCIVVLNDAWGVTVSGSANLTNNPRVEKYVIGTHRQQAIAEHQWIDQVMDGAHPFKAIA